MTTSKGPWSYDAESGMVTTRDTTGDWTANSGPKGITVVCTVESLDGISNGALLAAAPELFETAKAIIGMLELFADELRIKESADGVDRQSADAFRKLADLCAAIAKAEA